MDPARGKEPEEQFSLMGRMPPHTALHLLGEAIDNLTNAEMSRSGGGGGGGGGGGSSKHGEPIDQAKPGPMDGGEQLIRSSINKTGFKGVVPNQGRYKAQCDTSPCHNSHLGTFGTPEEAGQAYLQHYRKEHPEELKKERMPSKPDSKRKKIVVVPNKPWSWRCWEVALL